MVFLRHLDNRFPDFIEGDTAMPALRLTRQEVLARIAREWIVAVIRADSMEQARKVAEALRLGGVTIIEITCTCPDAPGIIQAISAERPELLIGAGTVCTVDEARSALQAGAQFIVSPGIVEEVVVSAKARDVAIMPGAVTPTEIIAATRLGSDVIKLFPGSTFGPSYAKALRGPFPNVRFMPTGGVSLGNLREWKEAGVVAVGVGGELVLKEALQGGRYEAITARARAFVEAIHRLGS
jgi:2-dehydro-3-deoxyphosphogluconate aldolase/(4S)-4-hydroxy-2-oxoglutarate aldolase